MYFYLLAFFQLFYFFILTKMLSFSVWQNTASVMPKGIVIIIS